MIPLKQQLTPPGGWQTPGRVRLAPLTRQETSFPVRVLQIIIGKVGKLEASNLFLMLMRNFPLFWSWLNFAKRLMPFGGLDRRETEIAILRVAWNTRSRYEWGQHVDIGLRAGLSAEEIVRVTEGAEADGWAPHLVAVLRACDEINQDRMIAEETWNILAAHYSDKLLLELVMLINHYYMLAGVLNSTGLPLDTRLEGVLASSGIHGDQ